MNTKAEHKITRQTPQVSKTAKKDRLRAIFDANDEKARRFVFGQIEIVRSDKASYARLRWYAEQRRREHIQLGRFDELHPTGLLDLVLSWAGSGDRDPDVLERLLHADKGWRL